MTWDQRYRLRRTARTSLVLWGGLALVAALVVAPAVRWLERETGWVIFGFNPDGARAILNVLVGSMLTFIVFVLSATLIVVQLASGQSTPRVIGLVLAAPGVKVALCMLTFTYAYTLSALGRVEARTPDLHASVAVVLNLTCVVIFLLFVQRLSAELRPSALVRLVADRARLAFELAYPFPHAPDRLDRPAHPPIAVNSEVVTSDRSGVVMAFGTAELVRLAEQADAVVELVPQVGDFIVAGDPLFRVAGPRPVPASDLRACVAIGPERTLEQDPRFVFRLLVDIASKALSPAINDPTTAVQSLDQIEHLLRFLGRRRLDDGRILDRAGKLRLAYSTPDWPDFVMLAVSEIRQFGAGSLQIDRRLRAMLEHLLEVLPPDRRPPLRDELSLVGTAIERSFPDEEDRRRARVADCQGVGASEA